MSRRRHFIETASGKAFQPLSPNVADISIGDIAHALSHQCRFNGHVHTFYSVGEHSVRVAELLQRWSCPREVILWGLLHDASEAYLVDLPTPIKSHPDFAAYKVAETAMQAAVCERFDLPKLEPPAVKRADAILLATEARDLMPYRPEHWSDLPEKPLTDLTIIPWAPRVARSNFIAFFARIAE